MRLDAVQNAQAPLPKVVIRPEKYWQKLEVDFGRVRWSDIAQDRQQILRTFGAHIQVRAAQQFGSFACRLGKGGESSREVVQISLNG
ncbi:hypothetical protein ACNRBV_03970 [Ralstonia pseudosolanacearum]|nr:hypothetical protein [Ralstonia pseudosolanacearum]